MHSGVSRARLRTHLSITRYVVSRGLITPSKFQLMFDSSAHTRTSNSLFEVVPGALGNFLNFDVYDR